MNAPAARLEFPRHIPFVQTLGFELWAFGDGHAELRFTPAAGHLNSHHATHGGALMTLLDVAMAHAARSVVADDGPGVVTIEMKTSFLRAADGPLTAHGQLLHKTRTMAFTEARIVNAQGALCAHATGTFKYMPVPQGNPEAGPNAVPGTGPGPVSNTDNETQP